MHGVSTRSVDDLVQAMGMSGISKSQVSRLCAEIDDKVKAFLARPIEGDWPYLWIDATYVKVRRNGRIVSVAVIVAVGVNGDGRREVLGMDIGPFGSHKGKAAREAIRKRRAHLIFLPPYSPDLNPIEQLFAKFKHLMRKAQERTHEATWRKVGELLDLVLPTECANYLRNSGYAAV